MIVGSTTLLLLLLWLLWCLLYSQSSHILKIVSRSIDRLGESAEGFQSSSVKREGVVELEVE